MSVKRVQKQGGEKNVCKKATPKRKHGRKLKEDYATSDAYICRSQTWSLLNFQRFRPHPEQRVFSTVDKTSAAPN